MSREEYNVNTITFAEEEIGTDVVGSPRETINRPLIEQVLIAREEAEARKLKAVTQ